MCPMKISPWVSYCIVKCSCSGNILDIPWESGLRILKFLITRRLLLQVYWRCQLTLYWEQTEVLRNLDIHYLLLKRMQHIWATTRGLTKAVTPSRRLTRAIRRTRQWNVYWAARTPKHIALPKDWKVLVKTRTHQVCRYCVSIHYCYGNNLRQVYIDLSKYSFVVWEVWVVLTGLMI